MNTGAITIIVKPTSECNFRCKYCYHADTGYTPGFLEIDKLEKLIRLTLSEYDRVEFVWHGGEPLLCGIDYFQRIVDFQNKYRRNKNIIVNSVQTNGSLLNNHFIRFFKKNDFSVGISIDGAAECNSLRQSTDEVIRNMDSALRAGVKVASLSVIHALNVDRQIEMYEFFKNKNVPMKFNPIFNSGSAIQHPEYFLAPETYINALKKFFDYWLVDQTAVRVDPIDQYIRMKLLGRANDCIYGSCLYQWLGVDHNGEFYPCGRSYPPIFRFTSISEIDHISDIFKKEEFIRILKCSIVRRSHCQAECKYFGVCNGGCNNNALVENGNVEINGGFLCETLKEMYDYISTSIDSIISSNISLSKYNPLIKQELNRRRIKEEIEDI